MKLSEAASETGVSVVRTPSPLSVLAPFSDPRYRVSVSAPSGGQVRDVLHSLDPIV